MKKIVYSTIALTLFLPISFIHAYTFTQDLKVGSRGQEVLELQKILNLNPLTQVAQEGPGSLGKETLFFGEKTKQAVIQLQNMNAETILAPLGLTQGTGLVGKSTRDFLNNFVDNYKPYTQTNTDTDQIVNQMGGNLNSTSTSSNTEKTDVDNLINQLGSGKNSTTTKSDAEKTEVDNLIDQLGSGKGSTGTIPTKEKTEVDKIIDEIGENLRSTSTNSIILSGFIISPSRAKPGQKIYIGSEKDISTVEFKIGSTSVRSKCFTKHTCELEVPENSPLGITSVKTNDPQFDIQKFEVISSSVKKPQFFNLDKLSLSEDNLIKGKYFAAEMTIYTPYGVFTTQTKDNAFILEFPKTRPLKPASGFFFVENKNALRSDILTIPYEK